MSNKIQEIFINLDDSGKLTPKEKVSVYGGLVFLSKKEKDKFITQYRKIINEIKCKYCKCNPNNCSKTCPEIKNTTIKQSDKRWLMNYLKKYYIVALVINNGEVYEHIIMDKAAKGRFTDYCIRRLIKDIVKTLIKNKRIDANKPLRLVINIDEQSTKSNGYYNLHDGLLEELKYGIVNYNYSKVIQPIIKSSLEIRVTYQDSGKSYVVQAADLLAGTIRRVALDSIINDKGDYEELSELVDYKVILP